MTTYLGSTVFSGSVTASAVSRLSEVTVTTQSTQAIEDASWANYNLCDKQINFVTSVETNSHTANGVRLPDSPATGLKLTVYNKTSYDIKVYPGDGNTIDGGTASTGYYWLANGSVQEFLCTAASTWIRLNRGLRYVQAADKTELDYGTADLPTFNAWTDLDISSKITPAAYGKPVQFTLNMQDNDNAPASGVFRIRKNGAATVRNGVWAYDWDFGTEVVIRRETGICECDSSGVIEYFKSTGIDTSQISILGWYVEG